MRYFSILLLFVSLSNFSLSNDTIVKFHGSELNLPNGYKQFSIKELNAFKATIFNREIMTVFERKTSENGIERIIIYYDSLSQTKNMSFDETVRIKFDVLEEGGIELIKPTIDDSNYCVFGKCVTEGDTSIFGFSIDINGMMGIQYDNSLGINAKSLRDFQRIIKTIKHDCPFEYIRSESQEAKKAKEEMNSSGVLMTFAFILMILVWLVRKYGISKN